MGRIRTPRQLRTALARLLRLGVCAWAVSVAWAEPARAQFEPFAEVERLAVQAGSVERLLAPGPLSEEYFHALQRLYGGLTDDGFQQIRARVLHALMSTPLAESRLFQARPNRFSGTLEGLVLHPNVVGLDPEGWSAFLDRQSQAMREAGVAKGELLLRFVAARADGRLSAADPVIALITYDAFAREAGSVLSEVSSLSNAARVLIVRGDRPGRLLYRKRLEARSAPRAIHSVFALQRGNDCLSGCAFREAQATLNRLMVPAIEGADLSVLFREGRWVGHVLTVPTSVGGQTYLSLEAIGQLSQPFVQMGARAGAERTELDAWIEMALPRLVDRARGFVVGSSWAMGSIAVANSRASVSFALGTSVGEAASARSLDPEFEQEIRLVSREASDVLPQAFEPYAGARERLIYEVTAKGAGNLNLLGNPADATGRESSMESVRQAVNLSTESAGRTLSRYSQRPASGPASLGLSAFMLRLDREFQNPSQGSFGWNVLLNGGATAFSGYLLNRETGDAAFTGRSIKHAYERAIHIHRFLGLPWHAQQSTLSYGRYAIRRFLNASPQPNVWDVRSLRLNLRGLWLYLDEEMALRNREATEGLSDDYLAALERAPLSSLQPHPDPVWSARMAALVKETIESRLQRYRSPQFWHQAMARALAIGGPDAFSFAIEAGLRVMTSSLQFEKMLEVAESVDGRAHDAKYPERSAMAALRRGYELVVRQGRHISGTSSAAELRTRLGLPPERAGIQSSPFACRHYFSRRAP